MVEEVLRKILQSKKKTRNEIEKVEEMYRLLADHSNDLICLQESDSTFKYISPSIKNLLGYHSSELLGKKIFDIVHKEDLFSLKKSIVVSVFEGATNDAFSYRARHKKGHFIWLETLGSPVFKDAKISSYVTSSRDVTQAVMAKKKIQRNQKSLQQLTTEITLMEEKQKKDIATNIHDHLSQSLVISKMRLKRLKINPRAATIDEDLQFIETHISKAIENSRKITYELSPPALYQLGVIEALNWLLEDLETTHKIKCSFKSNVTTMKLDDAKSILLYRSIQEVITNAIKYANASLITCSFDKNKHGIDIFIADNGVGFDTSILKNHNHSGSSFGLFSVQERIRNIQGEFNIESEINTGTTVKMLIPLSK